MKHWDKATGISLRIGGEELKEFNLVLKQDMKIPAWPEDAARYDHYFFFPQGAIYVVTIQFQLPKRS